MHSFRRVVLKKTKSIFSDNQNDGVMYTKTQSISFVLFFVSVGVVKIDWNNFVKHGFAHCSPIMWEFDFILAHKLFQIADCGLAQLFEVLQQQII